jgi:hypothetical protein
LLIAGSSLAADQLMVRPAAPKGTSATIQPQNGSLTATANTDRPTVIHTGGANATTATSSQNAGPQTAFPVGSGSHKGEIPGGVAACYPTCAELSAPDPLTPGSPLTFIGDNNCATAPSECPAFGAYNGSWEPRFTTSAALDVTLEYCGSGNFNGGNAWLNLAVDCPCSSFSAAASYNWSECGDNRLTLKWSGLPAGTYYYIVLYDPSYDSVGDYTITVSAAEPPPPPGNDDCSTVTPTVIAVPGSATFYGDTSGATSDCPLLGWQEAWEAFTITDSANVTVDYCGTSPSFNTVGIILTTGCPCDSLIFAGAYDFSTCGDGNASIFYSGLAAGTYYNPIYAGAGNQHAYTCTITTSVPPPPPPNDDCSSVTPTLISVPGSATFYGDNSGATADCPLLGWPDAWEAFETDATADVTIDFCGTSPPFGSIAALIMNDCPCTGYTYYNGFGYCPSDGNYALTYYGLPAGDYWVPIYSGAGNTHAYQMNITAVVPPPPPPNDNCGDVTPTVLNPGDSVTFYGNNAGATNDCPILGAREAWEAITLTGPASVTVDLCGTDPAFNTGYIVYVPDCPCSTYIFASSYDFNCGNLSVNYCSVPEGTMYIPIYSEAGSIGDYVMNVTTVGGGSTPPNDDCSGSVGQTMPAGGGTLTYTGDNTGATPDCPYLGWPGEVWEQFTTTETLKITIDWCGTSPAFTTFGIVLDPSCPCSGSFTYASSYDFFTCGDGNATIKYDNVPAGTWYVPVYSDCGSNSGPYTMTINGEIPPPPPPDDNCEDAVIHDLCGDPPSITVSGDNTGATPDCPALGGPGETWLAFESHDAQDITVSYCGQSPPFQNAYIVITDNCPCDDYTFYSTYYSCGDGNYAVVWYGLPAGTYWYPVLKDAYYGAEGPYTITVTGTVAYECASACCPADTDCNGSVNGQDIDGFIDCLTNGPPTDPCSPCVCDSNGDGSINGQDIQGFIDALSAGGC